MAKRCTLVCLTIFIFITGHSFGQQKADGRIKAVITEKQSKDKVPGASVLLENMADTLYKKSLLSDGEGRFTFTGLENGSYKVTITYIGFRKYSSHRILISNSIPEADLGVITLDREEAKDLREIVVNATKQVTEQQVDKTVVNVDALISNTGTTAFDVLNNAPGVVLDDGGNASLKGKDGVRVFIDGKPSYLTGRELTGYLKSVPSGTIDKIELMSNPPARYNAEGTGGIINIRTKKLKSKGFNGSVNLNYSQGVYAKTNNSASFNYRNDKVNIFGNAGYTLQNNFVNSDRDRNYSFKDVARNYTLKQHYFEKNKRQGFNYKVGADYNVSDKTTIGIVLSDNHMSPYKETGRYNSLFLRQEKTDSTIYINSNVEESSRNFTGNANFRHQFNKKGRELNVDVDYLKYRYSQQQRSESVTYQPDSAISDRYNLHSNNPFHAEIYGGKIDYVHMAGDGMSLEGGAQSIYSRRNSEGIYFNGINDATSPATQLNNKFSYNENINALYVNFSKDFNRFSLIAGLRMENTNAKGTISTVDLRKDSSFRKDYTDLFPTVSLSYKFDSSGLHVLTLAGGRRITRPGYQELNPSVFFFDKYTSYQGNPLLTPEYATNLELNYSYDGSYTVGVYYSRVKGTITQLYTQVDSAFISKPYNLELVTNAGITANVSHNLTKWWSVNLYMELVNARFRGWQENNVYLDNSRTNFRINGSTKVQLGSGWSAEVSGFYKTRMVIGQAILEPAWKMNAAVQKKVMKNKGSITVSGLDIFRSWVVDRNINIPEGHVFISNMFDTHLINIGFNYRFGKAVATRERKNSIENEQQRVDSN
ncbi:TonB-dependent receptor [Chitinophaga sp. G-6-1-13]|uniref:TonB-dependent receptor n=1 Tax=Chitinophaga fulva TaxID=2728842 RepID=A0A848GP44_9BACT|nr:TonB-dependent receptor [Chitinophaga fulva]NML39139.1 TonB-dependent receptor [Chitinophaga fulva]